MAKEVKFNGGPANGKRHSVEPNVNEVTYTKVAVGESLIRACGGTGSVSYLTGRYVPSDAKLKDGTEIWQWMGWIA